MMLLASICRVNSKCIVRILSGDKTKKERKEERKIRTWSRFNLRTLSNSRNGNRRLLLASCFLQSTNIIICDAIISTNKNFQCWANFLAEASWNMVISVNFTRCSLLFAWVLLTKFCRKEIRRYKSRGISINCQNSVRTQILWNLNHMSVEVFCRATMKP